MRCECLNTSSCGSSEELICGTHKHMFSPQHHISSADNRAIAWEWCTLYVESSCGSSSVTMLKTRFRQWVEHTVSWIELWLGRRGHLLITNMQHSWSGYGPLSNTGPQPDQHVWHATITKSAQVLDQSITFGKVHTTLERKLRFSLMYQSVVWVHQNNRNSMVLT